MKAGIPINCFHEIFEESSFRLTSCDRLRQLIPFIHQQEQKNIKSLINGTIIFDGTTHVCEALVIVLRFVDDNWDIQQRFVDDNWDIQQHVY